MNLFRNLISFSILAVAALGLLFSLMHYHSHTFDSLHHAGEKHFVEDETDCPFCAIHVQFYSDDLNSYEADLEFKEYVVSTDDIFLNQENFDSPLGRSPPAMA